MKQSARAAGFTLIEILVALVLIGVLGAFVVPGVVQQIGSADAPKVVNDLTALRTAVNSFHANMSPALPGDIEDLVHKPVRRAGGDASDSDLSLTGVAFTSGQINRWNGQYIEVLVERQDAGVATGEAIRTGFGAYIQQAFVCFDPNSGNVSRAVKGNLCSDGHYVAAAITGVSQADFLRVNDLIDGDNPAESNAAKMAGGRFRFDASSGGPQVAYYLVTPFRR